MKIDIQKIFLILFLSSIVGIIFNYINPAGISLIRQQKTLILASDSLIISKNNLDEKESTDSVEITTQLTNITNEQILNEEKKDISKLKKTELPNNEDELTNNFDAINQNEEIISEPRVINLEQAFTLFNNGAKFIDARDKVDFDAGHIADAINLPYYQFEKNEIKLKNIDNDEAVVTYCNGTDCDLSVMLGNKLAEMGYKKVFIFFGGWWDWVEAKYPIITNGEN